MERKQSMASGVLAVFILALLFIGTVEAKGNALIINEVGFKEDSDFIELKALEAGNYSGYMLYEGAVHIATLPDFGQVATHALFLGHAESEAQQVNQENEAFNFYDIGGLTGTDNVIQLKDPDGLVVDSLLWSNNNQSFTGNRTQANFLVNQGLWIASQPFSSTFDQDAWIDSDDVLRGFSLNALEGVSGTSPLGYQIDDATPGFEAHENVPPTALFTISGELVTGSTIQFDASGSFDPDSDDLQFQWEVGNEVIGEEESVDYVFDRAGDVEITLTVFDTKNETAEKSIIIAVAQKEYNHDVRISELLPNPTGSDIDGEFIEIENMGNVPLQISGYSLSDGVNTYGLPDRILQQGSFATFYRSKTKIALNNSGETVFLKDPDGVEIMSLYYEKSFEGKSFSYIDGGYAWTSELTPSAQNRMENVILSVLKPEEVSEPDEPATPRKEPKKKENMPLKADRSQKEYYSQIYISEFLPNPAGKDQDGEWIELFNYGSTRITLDGWKLDDENGGSSPFKLDGMVIEAKHFLVIDRSVSGIQLNNTKDSVRLINPLENEIDAVRYLNVPGEDFAFARNAEQIWEWTIHPTRGAVNNITVPQKKKISSKASKTTSKKKVSPKKRVSSRAKTKENALKMTIEEALTQEKGIFVEIEGAVTVEPGMISKRMFFIGNEATGIQIFKSKGDVPEVAIGDYIMLRGKVSVSKGEKRLLLQEVSDIKSLEADRAINEIEVRTGDIDNAHVNRIVRTKALVEKREGNTLFVDDGSGALRVYISKGSELSAKDFSEGEEISIVGIIRKKDEHIALYPRMKEDMSIVGVTSNGNGATQESNTPSKKIESNTLFSYTSVLWLVVGGIVFSWIVFLLHKKYQAQK